MRKKALALSAIIVAVVSVAYLAWFVQNQLTILKNENSYLQNENSGLLEDKRSLADEKKDLENQNDNLIERIGNLTSQLALARSLRVEIVAFSHEAQWSHATFLGVDRASMRYNITVRNNDAVALSGLDLTVRTYSGPRPVGSGSYQLFSLLLAEEEQTVNGSLTMSFGEPTTDLSLLATLRSGDTVVDELRLSGIASPF